MFKRIKIKISEKRYERFCKKQSIFYDAVNDMGRRISELEKQVAELSKRTVSQRTTEEEVVPFSKVVDEWLNGAEEADNGD